MAASEGPGRTKAMSPRSKFALGLLGLVMLGLAIAATIAAFNSTTSNSGNSFQAGTVVLSDNDADSAMLALVAAKPGDSDTSCIRVSFTGTLASTVRLYGTTSGTGLDQYLTLTITRGTTSGSPTFDSCANFTADATNYVGAGAGVIYTGTLEDFADNYDAGVVDPTSGSPESWTNGESHDYKFVVSLNDDNSAQGLNATQTFTWEARSS
jgi:predicted ribosomally synthesized peptide with SipW-like signal peptide